MANVEATLMISFSDKVLKLFGRFFLAWQFSGTNSCSSFHSNLKQKKLTIILNFYRAKANLIFVN